MTDEGGTTGAAREEPLPAETATAAVDKGTPLVPPRRRSFRRPLLLVLLLIVFLAAALVLPPLVNIGRYQRQITALMSRSMGRPVRLSSVELRLLPMPGFVLHDLSVSEDPAFGAEPILSAGTVVASIRLFSLWRGRVEISRVSVDEASLNLVRSPSGRWNLEALMMGPAQPVLTGKVPPVAGKPAQFPYLEATNSRVNLKNGLEKSPFSVVNADLSFWQDQPGEWRIRLRGQPVRTDTELSPAGPGEVRMEATVHSAAQLRDVPFRVQMEWRDAELGQLSRILLGSDAGWRGDMRADIEISGTPESAQTKARLRATDVRREEFAPETLLDLDANCSFVFQHSHNAVHKLACDTAIGNGHLHLTGDLPGNAGAAQATLEVQQIPVQAGLDLLRTVRGGFAPGITAKGNFNGSLTYREPVPSDPSQTLPGRPAPHPNRPARLSLRLAAKTAAEATAVPELQGELRLEGLEVKGGELKETLALPKITFTPNLSATPQTIAPRPSVAISGPSQSHTQSHKTGSDTPSGPTHMVLETRFIVPLTASGTASVTAQSVAVRLSLAPEGYSASIAGTVEPSRFRDLAYAFGMAHLDAVDGFAASTPDSPSDSEITKPVSKANKQAEGKTNEKAPDKATDKTADKATENPADRASSRPANTATIDLSAVGLWLPSQLPSRFATRPVVAPAPVSLSAAPSTASSDADSFAGTIRLRRVDWQAPYLARPVQLSQATLAISPDSIHVTSDFTYGALKGSLTVGTPSSCEASNCEMQVQLHLGAIDAYAIQTALLAPPAQKSLLSPLMSRVSSASSPQWPLASIDVQADSLTLGPAVLQKPRAHLRLTAKQVNLESWEATLLDGQVHGTGTFVVTNGKPQYAFDATLTHVSAAGLGQLLNSHWSGGSLDGHGAIKLSGLTDKDLAASAAGKADFQWAHGIILSGASSESADSASDPSNSSGSPTPPATATSWPAALAHFDRWSGTVTFQNSKIQLDTTELIADKRHSFVTGTIPFSGPAKLTVSPLATPVGK